MAALQRQATADRLDSTFGAGSKSGLDEATQVVESKSNVYQGCQPAHVRG
jgi:hypothetical protein